MINSSLLTLVASKMFRLETVTILLVASSRILVERRENCTTSPMRSPYLITSPTAKYSPVRILVPMITSFSMSCSARPTMAPMIPRPAIREETFTPWTCRTRISASNASSPRTEFSARAR